MPLRVSFSTATFRPVACWSWSEPLAVPVPTVVPASVVVPVPLTVVLLESTLEPWPSAVALRMLRMPPLTVVVPS